MVLKGLPNLGKRYISGQSYRYSREGEQTDRTPMECRPSASYRALGAAFYVNDAQLAGLRTVVDAYGRPLLQDPSHESGNPTLWGYPLRLTTSMNPLASCLVSIFRMVLRAALASGSGSGKRWVSRWILRRGAV